MPKKTCVKRMIKAMNKQPIQTLLMSIIILVFILVIVQLLRRDPQVEKLDWLKNLFGFGEETNNSNSSSTVNDSTANSTFSTPGGEEEDGSTFSTPGGEEEDDSTEAPSYTKFLLNYIPTLMNVGSEDISRDKTLQQCQELCNDESEILCEGVMYWESRWDGRPVCQPFILRSDNTAIGIESMHAPAVHANAPMHTYIKSTKHHRWTPYVHTRADELCDYQTFEGKFLHVEDGFSELFVTQNVEVAYAESTANNDCVGMWIYPSTAEEADRKAKGRALVPLEYHLMVRSGDNRANETELRPHQSRKVVLKTSTCN